jgi:surfactin synthase thioesterase subunit
MTAFALFPLSTLDSTDSAVVGDRAYLLLPPAGATLAALREVAAAAPGAAVWGVEYPGRGARVADPLPASLAGLAGEVARELARCGPRLVLVGFSMGAFVALELAMRPEVAPVALVVVGAVAPQRRVPGRYARPDADALARLLDDRVPGLRDSPEVWEYALDLLRADLRLASAYRGPAGRVPCPIVALCGADDPSLDSLDDATGAWRSWTAGPFAAAIVPGGHLGLLAPGRGGEFWAWMRRLTDVVGSAEAGRG